METYKTEKTLSLVGAIIGSVAFVVMLIWGIAATFVGAAFLAYSGYGGGLIAAAIIAIILAAISVIFGFIATGKLKKGIKKGGIFAIIAAGLALIACIVGIVSAAGWMLFPSIALYLTAGIMVLAKKTPAEAPPA